MNLPAYARPDLWLDEDNAVEFIRWKDESDPYGARWWHRCGPNKPAPRTTSGWCMGGFQWRKPSEILTGPVWDLLSADPLTISPSLLCSCGAHGFIREGKWAPA